MPSDARVNGKRRRWRPLVTALSLALLTAACGGAQTMLEPQGPYAEDPDNLFKITLVVALVVFVVVQGLIIAAAVKFRERKGDDSMPEQVHGNTRMEILWTVIPALILVGIAIPTIRMVFDLAEEPEGALTVNVIGHRWWWEFEYPAQPEFGIDETIVTANELVIPVGVPVRLEMTAEEAGGPANAVIHSFWIPALGGKRDVVPGRITPLNLQADHAGEYIGQCAEYCGLSHANMRARAISLDGADWDAWVDNQLSLATIPGDGLAADGAAFFTDRGGQQTCVACHAIKGLEGANGITGPDLTHLMSRDWFAGAILEMNEENLRAWLADPTALKPMQPDASPPIGMPNLNLTPAEIDALVAFLLTLD
ncbi:MAG: cytochrome c oxidase subunit II [Nitriliruptorales bacterium]|nr:cytochrome c oxidase subunit II [Nitriliruptorales bacterium]